MKHGNTKIGDVFSVKLDDNKKKYFQLVEISEHQRKYFQNVSNDLIQLNSDVVSAFKRGLHRTCFKCRNNILDTL